MPSVVQTLKVADLLLSFVVAEKNPAIFRHTFMKLFDRNWTNQLRIFLEFMLHWLSCLEPIFLSYYKWSQPHFHMRSIRLIVIYSMFRMLVEGCIHSAKHRFDAKINGLSTKWMYAYSTQLKYLQKLKFLPFINVLINYFISFFFCICFLLL